MSPPGGTFCIFCGAPLAGLVTDDAAGTAGEGAAMSRAPSPEDEVLEVRRALVRLTDRVAALEALQRGPVPQAPQQTPAAPSDLVAGPFTEQGAAAAGQPPAYGEPAPGGPPETPPSWGLSIDWEQVLGRNWLAIIGGIALVIGIGFFLRLAFENNWIGVTGRIILGIVSGLVVLGIGEYAQRRYPVWAQAVTGSGIGILYLSIYAAFGFYQLIAPAPAFLFLALVVVLSGLLALRYESLVIALLGIGGAFLTPVLLARDLPSDQRFLLLLYILLVDAGILGVSTFRHWRWLTLLGLVASYALFGLWRDRVPASDIVLAQVGLTGIFLIFVGATTLFHILWRRVPGRLDMALMTLNAAAYFGNTSGLLWARYEAWFGIIALALSLFYGLVGYASIRRSGAPPQVALFALATALVFLTVAVPLQLTGHWITVAWAAQAAALVWVGLLLRSWPTRAFGLGVFAIAAFRLLVFDTPVELAGFRLLLNTRFPTFAVSIAAFYVAAYLYWRARGHLAEWERYTHLALMAAANIFTLWVLSAEVIAYFDSLARAKAFDYLAMRDAEGLKYLSLTVLWAVYALGLLAIALATRFRLLRWAGLGLLSIPVLKLLLFDTFVVRLDPRTFRLFLNYHFLTFLVVLGVVLFAAYLYRRERDRLPEAERYALPGLLVAANLIALWVLSAESLRFFGSREAVLRTDLESAKHLTLTTLWAVYGIGVISVGVLRRSSAVRLAGMALLAVPVVKLFVFDVFLLQRGYRVAAFITLGVLLLATGLAYQRYNKAIRGFLFGRPS